MKTVVFAYHDMGCLGIEACWLPVTKLAPFLPILIIPVKKPFMVRLPDWQRKEAFRFTRRITLIIHYGWSALPNCHQR
ncbi:Uncharacterised protein [Escherichia coli]|nr:Uncharacterised protein [Escherichia coli]